MSGVLLGSALEEAAKRLPKALKPEAVVPTLKKAGVKDEELQLSGIGVKLPEFLKTAPKDDKGRVSGEGISNMVLGSRDDLFSTTERKATEFQTGYDTYVPEGIQPRRQNYVERVYNFENSNSVKNGSGHFADEGYLMHTRLWDDLIDNQDTRVVGELQSDVHQKGKVEGEAAWKTSWMRKGLENEIKQAIKEGKQQVAVPIKNAPVARKDHAAALSGVKAKAFELLRPLNDESYDDEINKASEAILDAFPSNYNVHDADFGEQTREIINLLAYGSRTEADINEAFDQIARIYTDYGDYNESARHGVETMLRGSGVQKWYETAVGPTVQKLAKQLGADFKTVDKGGVDYAVIDLTKPGVKESADKSFKLYAGGGAVAYYMAVQQEGLPVEDVDKYMLDAGFTEEEIAKAKEQQPQVKEALAQGIAPEDISDYLEPAKTEESKPVPQLDDLPKEQQDVMKRLVSGEMMPADELVAAMQVIKPNMSSVTTRMASFFGDNEAMRKAEAAELGVIKNIQELGAKRGLDLQFEEGEWVVNTPNGPVAVTPGILEGIVAEKGEVAGSMAGGVYGALRGMGMAGPVASPGKRAVGAVVGGLTGAIAGGVLGTEFDYMYQSMKLQEEMSAEIAAHKALTASEAAAYGEVVGLGLVKFGGTLWQGAKRAKNFIMDGNTEGARKALREVFFLSEDEISEIVQRFERVVDTTGMSAAEKEIKAVATTVPGAEMLTNAATALDSRASRAVIKNVNERANQLLEASGDMTTETGRLLKQDLDAYVNDVKSQYDAVKVKAAENPRNKYYKFNLDTVAVKPVLESLAEGITDPAIRERFLLQMKQAKRYTDNRTFSDLVELRQLVNEFRFNKRISKPADYAALDEVIQNIDGKLEKGANWLFGKEGAKQWLGEFAQARKDYAQMKNVQKTVLYKVVNRPGVTPEVVSKALLKYSDSIDGNYEAVMSMLPKEMRRLAERDMINQLVNKYTIGQEGNLRATQFPMLAKDLSTRSFVDDESRQLVKAIDMLADVFRNDIRLGSGIGKMKIPEFQSYLTADPTVRAKMAAASTIFNEIKQRIPGSKEAREVALIKNAAKFLETPLNAKSVEALKAEAKDLVSLDEQIIAVQRAQANSIANELDASGQMLSFSGSGNILKYGETGPVKIAAHRIATPEVARQIAIGEGLSVDSKLLDDVLKRYGYKAVQYGSDKIKLLE